MAFPVKIYGSLVLNGEELSTTIIADAYPHYCRMLTEKVNSPETKTIKTTAEFWNATILFEIADKLREIDLTAEAPDVRVAKEVFLASYEECQRGLSENSRKLAEIKYYGTKIQTHLPTLVSEKLIPFGLKGFDRTIFFYEAVAKGEILLDEQISV